MMMIRPSHVCSVASRAAARACRPASGRAPAVSLIATYATHHQTSSPPQKTRRAVTPFNDDGRVPWAELSVAEKTARAAQQTVNLGLVVVGVVLTGGVAYLLFTEVFSPDSKVAAFNRAVARIKADPRCVELLGGDDISAYGESSTNKWQRARPIASTASTDGQGTEHLVMQFHVQGPRADTDGTVYLHLVRARGHDDFVYRYFYLDVPGRDRVYLEDNRATTASGADKKKKQTLFGINWSASK